MMRGIFLFLWLSSAKTAESGSSSVASFSGIKYRFAGSEASVIGLDSPPQNELRIPQTISGHEVTAISSDAFFGCSHVTSVVIPRSVKAIHDRAFYGCSALETIQFQDGSLLTHIHSRAFGQCRSLKGIPFPMCLKSLGPLCLSGCHSLTTVWFPGSVSSIGCGVFSNCRHLIWISVDSSNTHFKAVDGALYDFGMATLLQAPVGRHLITFQIPATVRVVANYSFSEYWSLETVSFPPNLTRIGLRAFEKCFCLKEISLPQSVVDIGSHSFVDCRSVESISFAFGSRLRSIGNFAFSGCRSLTSINFPSSLKAIGANSFSFCTALRTVRFPDTLLRIGPFAFAKCIRLQSISLPHSLIVVEQHAFSGCLSVKILAFPGRSRVARIEAAAFASLKNLTNLVLPESLTFLDQFAFSGCKSLVRLVLPEQLEVIRDYAFWGCKALAGSLSIPNSVRAVNLRAFGKTALRKIVVADCAVRIESDSFPESITAVVAPEECEEKFQALLVKRPVGSQSIVWAILFLVAVAAFGWNVRGKRAKKSVPGDNDHIPLIPHQIGYF
jgi:hypothetical protein